jgi:hypothetical protein
VDCRKLLTHSPVSTIALSACQLHLHTSVRCCAGKQTSLDPIQSLLAYHSDALMLQSIIGRAPRPMSDDGMPVQDCRMVTDVYGSELELQLSSKNWKILQQQNILAHHLILHVSQCQLGFKRGLRNDSAEAPIHHWCRPISSTQCWPKLAAAWNLPYRTAFLGWRSSFKRQAKYELRSPCN